MTGADVPLYGLDIETDTTFDGLDPACSEIVAVAVSSEADDVVLLGPEHDLLVRLDALLAGLEPGLIVTWNGAWFDLPFLATRAARLGVALGLELLLDRSIRSHRRPLPGTPGAYRASWGAHDHLDGYLLYRADVGRSFGLPCGLKPLSRLVGLEPVEVDRSRIHELSDAQMRAYVASDARLARELVARRLPAALPFADRVTDRRNGRNGDRSPQLPLDPVRDVRQTA